MFVRGYRETDLEDMIDLRKKYYQDINEGLTVRDIKEFKRNIRKSKTRPDMKVYVADVDGFAGYVFLKIENTDVFIKGIHVSPESQGRGYGDRLMEKAIKWAESKDADTMTLTVKPENTKAKKLYQKKDFELDRLLMKKRMK